MVLKDCARCKRLIPYGKKYCKGCEGIMAAQLDAPANESRQLYNRRYNEKRDPKFTRFYHSAAWRTLSAVYMQKKQYKCEGCGKIASEVHHKIPIQTDEGWKLRLDENNLKLVCKRCHNKEHDRF